MSSRDDTTGSTEGQQTEIWPDRVLCALDALAALGQDATPTRIKEMVGARFASYFTADARLYEGSRPAWEREVDDAVAALVARKVVAGRRARKGDAESGTDEVLRITKSGQAALVGACERGIPAAEEPDASAAEFASAAAFEPWVESNVELPGVFTPALREMFFPPAPLQMIGDVQIVRMSGEAAPGELPYGDLRITNPRIFSTDPRHQQSVIQWPKGIGSVVTPWAWTEQQESAPADVDEAPKPGAAADPPLPVVIELN